METSDRAREAAPRYGSDSVLLTYDDYCRMPAGLRYELVEGDMRMVPSPGTYHQEVSLRLKLELIAWVKTHDLGKVYDAPLDVVLSEHNVVQPDILYVSRDRLGIIKQANIWGAPDLVIEILSPSTSEWDRMTKRRAYAKFGVQEMWIVDPEGKSIEVAARQGNDLVTLQVYSRRATLVSPLLPGFTLELDVLFS